MRVEINGGDHESAHDAPPSALVERRRKTKGLMTCAITSRPMSADAERRFRAALQRVLADLVALRLQGPRERES